MVKLLRLGYNFFIEILLPRQVAERYCMLKSIKLKWGICFFFSLALLWAFILPPFQGTDESAHFGQVRLWSTASQIQCRNEIYAMAQVYRTAALRFNPLSTYAGPETGGRRDDPHFYDHGCEHFMISPLYYLVTSLVLTIMPDNLELQFYALRILGAILFSMAFYVIARISTLLFGDTKDQILFTLLIGFQPIFIISTLTISYDGLLNFIFLLSFWTATSFLSQKGVFAKYNRFMLFAILLSILGLTTKLSGIFLPFFFFFALIISKKLRWSWALFFLGGLIPLFLWFLFKVAHYTIPIAGMKTFFMETPWTNLQVLFIERWGHLFSGFWGEYGTQDGSLPFVFLLIFALFFIFSLGGIMKSYFKKTPNLSLESYSLICILFYEVVVTLTNIQTDHQSILDFGFVQGRYYFLLIAPLFYLFISGIKQWLTPHQKNYFYVGLIVFYLFYHFFFLGAIVIPRFYL